MACVGQLVERMPFKHMVAGSKPVTSTIPYSVVVIITAFHAVDPGSIPGMGKSLIFQAIIKMIMACVAQLVEHTTVNRVVMGSIPIASV